MLQGLYEQLINKLIAEQLAQLDRQHYYVRDTVLDQEEAAQFLANYLAFVIEQAFHSIRGEKKTQRQIEIANRVIDVLARELDKIDLSKNLIENEGRILEAVFSKLDRAVVDYDTFFQEIMPYTRLSQSELFTGSHADLSLDSELKKEILSADTICFLVAFIKWSGIRIFERELREFTRQEGKKLKIITTSYLGATDAKAVEFLASLPNTEVKVSYNTRQERLHAKAYLFLRHTGFHTGYIGSSNLSRTALTSGLEWNMKVTTREIRQIIDKFQKTFDTYWEDAEFELFDPHTDPPKLRQALQQQKSGDLLSPSTFFDIRPYPYQQEILDHLAAERKLHHRRKNLIVAATGTGKTIISAFDYQRFCQESKQNRLLFVAHRKEILEQAMATFQGILRDNNFGQLWVDKYQPDRYDHLFVSVQTLNNQLSSLPLSADYYDFIIIDEVHHISASSYRPILEKFAPQILLGLTATPERMDGQNILQDFDDHIASEIRLPEALNRKLLCPFQYFGVSDSVDLSDVTWRSGRYVPNELTKIYTENDRRVRDILQQLDRYLTDPKEVRALGFCVSQQHAEFMAEKFNLAGLPANYLVSNNSHDRERLREALKKKAINYLFVVDIFNEGVDLPEIDTVLFLRPTESLTIFLQQLGRGLRLAEGKECLTVLDFVGNARPEYDFAQKFRALIGRTRTPIHKEIADDFPHLPMGCAIVLERKAKEYILENIRNATVRRRQHIVEKVQNFSFRTSLPLSLKHFLHIYNLELEEVYKYGLWNSYLIDAGIEKIANSIFEKELYRTILKKWLGMHSFSYFQFLEDLNRRNFILDESSLTPKQKTMALMLHYDFWQEPGNKLGFKSLSESFAAIGKSSLVHRELKELLPVLMDRIEYLEQDADLNPSFPLWVYSRYTRDQILIAAGLTDFNKIHSSREGVAFSPELNAELLFVTLKKSEKDFSPTTMYDDYALSRELFHWQSQSTTGAETSKGLTYIHHQERNVKVLLFVREQNKNEYGNTMSYIFLGPVTYVNHYGTKPMSIIWKLKYLMPSWLWQESGKMAVG